MDKSAVSRICVTLRHFGYLQKNESTSKYSLGSKLIDLGSQVIHRYRQMDICDVARPCLQQLSEDIQEVVHLAVLDGHDVITLRKFGGDQMVTVNTKVGARYPAHSCSLGKALLSGKPEEDLKAFLASAPLVQRTPNTVVDPQKILEDVRTAGDRGYAYEDEESFPGICCVAVPIKDYEGHVTAAISATIPKQRGGDARMEVIRKHLEETGKEISSKIGGTY